MPEQRDEPAAANGLAAAAIPYGAGIDFSDPNSPLAPFYLRTSHLLALAVLTNLTALQRIRYVQRLANRDR